MAKTFPGADCGSDHVPVCGTIRQKLKKIKTAIRNIKLDVDTLRSDSDIKEKFTVAVKTDSVFYMMCKKSMRSGNT